MNTKTKHMGFLALVVALQGGLMAKDAGAGPEPAILGPADLALTFASPYDGSAQPFRLYLPSAYDGKQALPLVVALHGTGGDHNKYFDDKTYHDGIYKAEAETRGLIVLCPLGNDSLNRPTEWRGVGELHVLAAIDDVRRRFRIDADRIVCTGQSMGGTGTTYLCCRYPDIFAAGIPLASTYGHVSLVTNLRHVPMFFVQGEKDWPIYARTGPIPLTKEMNRLGYDAALWMVPDAAHNTMHVSTARVLDWALEQKRVSHPRHITHRAYFPPHGRAWWVEIQEIERPGWFAEVDAQMGEGNAVQLAVINTTRLVLRPDSALLDITKPVQVILHDKSIFNAICTTDEEISLALTNGGWSAILQPRHLTPRTEWQNIAIGTVGEAPTWEGKVESTLGNWLADAMRDISGADIAICNKGHFRYGKNFRGKPVEAGQTVQFIDFINWLRQGDAALATFKLSGSDLLEIIEDNIRDQPQDERFLVQVSGCRYRFDRSRPFGKRIVSSDINPDRNYRIVCNSSAITRTDTMHLAGRHGRIPFEALEPNLLSAAWRFAQQQGGRIDAALDGRVSEVTVEGAGGP